MKLKLLVIFAFLTNIIFSQNFHDTQGKLEISGNGQTTYSLPIALPPSIQNIGPTINLVYASGQMGGIVGQGWNISGISSISRISTRRDIDGYVDGVDFDSNDMLTLDGQRLLLTSGNYWADGSKYQTEVLSNMKIELKDSGAIMYFIVTAPDGSRSWYGNYGGTNAVDLTSFYITRYEDTNGNFITYNYLKPYNKSLCVSEIKFSANTNGMPSPLNIIKFNYKLAKRTENGYLKGLKIEKVELLDNIEVKTNNLLFKKYQISHIVDTQLGYERVSQLQEFNAALEPANPVVFDYQTTTTQINGSETLTTYANNLDFSSIIMSGDFDGDGRLDFTTESQLYKGVFQGSSGETPINFPTSLLNENGFNRFTATTISQNKLNQFQSIVNVVNDDELNTIEFKIFDLNANSLVNSYNKTIDIENTGVYGNDIEENIYCPGDCIDIISSIPSLNPEPDGSPYYNACNHSKPLKNKQRYYEGDFNGDGISEVFIVNEEVTRHKKYTNYIGTNGGQNCSTVDIVENASYYVLNLDSNKTTTLGSEGYVKLTNLNLLNTDFKYEERFVNDFNGDGKSDILVISRANENWGEYKIFSFKQLIISPWIELETIGQGVIDRYSYTKQMLFGDYNGDGKIDIMTPDGNGGPNENLWQIYYSNPNPAGGEFFVKESHSIVEYWPDTGTTYNVQRHYSNYFALDVNNDGKSDLVRVWRNYYKPSWTINDHDTQWKVTTFVNNIGNTLVTGNKFTADYLSPCSSDGLVCEHTDGSPDVPIPVVSKYRYGGLDNQMVMVRNHHNQLTYINFSKDVAKDVRLTKVTSSGGNIIDDIVYKSMNPSSANNGQGALNEFYSSNNLVNYPFVEIKRLPTNYLVSKITNTVDGVSKSQDFRYNGFIAHLHGLGSVGFNKTARSAWYQNSSSKRIWNVTENRSDWRGGLERGYSQLLDNGSAFTFVTSGNPLGIINSTINNFQSTSVNNVYKLSLTSQTSKDFLTNVSTQTSYLYDANYLLPTTVTTKNFTTDINNPTGTKVTTTVFDNNPSGLGNAYYIGRPLETISTTTAYGDTFSTKEIFTYTSNKISKIEKKGNITSSKYLVENFEYDAYGNVIKKTLSSSGYIAPQAFTSRVTEFTYDTTQRFVKTTKDIEGLISTNVSYDPIYGVVTESTNPYGLSNKTFIDNWGKVIKITDYLGKSVDISYSKANGEYTTTKIGEDGSNSIDVNDALARPKKSGSKNIDGTWSYSSIEYDYLGRKFKQSEPYSSGNPTQWNSNSYDDYGRLIKTTSSTGLITNISHNGLTVTATDGIITKSSTKNANEHVISATDNGGTINFTYFANGNLKQSDYNGTVIKMEYDEWGRKTKLDDPSAGIYIYTSNALGESITETTPNGTTTYTNDNFGKIVEKKIVGVNTNSKITYIYDATTKLLASLRYDDYNNGGVYDEYLYDYDAYKRLFATTENRFGAFFQKVTFFDAFGRVEKEAYNTIAGGKQSAKWVRNSYKNGHHWQILDDATNQVLWQTNTVNARGQLTNASLGNTIDITNTYDIYGYPTQFKHDKTGTTTSNVMTLNTTFEPQRGNLTNRYNSMFNWTENFQYDNQDRLTHYTNAQSIQVQQIYEVDGRIKENNLGKYNYSNSSKKYQNTSLDVNPESKAYYENRLGLFNDSMEQKIGWTVYWDPTTLSYDSTVSRSGSVSLKMNNTTTNEKIAFCETWTKIDNAVPTEYTYSAWVKSDGSNPQAELFLYMKTENETNSFTQVDNKISTTTNGWTLIEKTFLVPANIKKIQVRLDNNSTGVLWYDDVRIRKTSDATPSQRQLNISYNTFKSPCQIEETGVDKISFTYNYMNNRSSMYYGGLETDKNQRQYHKHYSADGSMEVKINTKTNGVEFITYIGGDAYSAPIVLKSDGTTQNYLYLHRDYLGSIVAITNATGDVVEKRLFDAWGEVIKIQDGQGNNLTAFAVLDRGYTGHEHLQSVGLIHMNGRLYDSKLHRFLQPDNFIQDPYNTQNYNRYGYVLNNPLKHTDPSGEELVTLTAAIIGAAIAAASYTMTALLADVPFTIAGIVKATFMGALSGTISSGIGSVASTINQLGTRFVFQALAHGISQGLISGIQGGDFMQGFASGALSSMAAGLWSGGNLAGGDGHWGGVGGSFGGTTTGTLLFGTVAGGAGALLAKGNFWQGAVTGLIVSGLNHAMHSNSEKISNKVNNELKKIGYEEGCIPDFNCETVEEMLQLSPELKRLNSLSNNKSKFYLRDSRSFGPKTPYGIVEPGNPDTVFLYRKAFTSAQQLFLTIGHELNHTFHNISNIRSNWKPSFSYRNDHSEALAWWWTIQWDNSPGYLKVYNKHNNLAPLSNDEKNRGY